MSPPKLIHYHAPNTRSFTIRWLFEELGSPPHELKILDMKKGEHKAPAFLAVNPMGKVPTVTADDTPVTEVGAIAIFLADLFPEADLAPGLSDPARGTYLRWIVLQPCGHRAGRHGQGPQYPVRPAVVGALLRII